jgi:hypothetical protein
MDVSLHTDTLTLKVSAFTALDVSTDVGQGIVDTVGIVANAAVVVVDTNDLIKPLLVDLGTGTGVVGSNMLLQGT